MRGKGIRDVVTPGRSRGLTDLPTCQDISRQRSPVVSLETVQLLVSLCELVYLEPISCVDVASFDTQIFFPCLKALSNRHNCTMGSVASAKWF